MTALLGLLHEGHPSSDARSTAKISQCEDAVLVTPKPKPKAAEPYIPESLNPKRLKPLHTRYQGNELPVGSRTSVTFRRLRRLGLTDSDAIWAPVSAEKRCAWLNLRFVRVWGFKASGFRVFRAFTGERADSLSTSLCVGLGCFFARLAWSSFFYSLHWCCCLRRCKIDRKARRLQLQNTSKWGFPKLGYLILESLK